MQTYYTKWHSPNIGREMEIKVYGHAGRPILFIPCQDGRFFDFESFHMDSVFAPWIESGQCMVFAIDTLDQETYSAAYESFWRIRRHEQWFSYICNEVVPFMQSMANDRNGWTGTPGCISFGCSLGATHAANLFFRRPDLFDGMLALSGIYDSEYGFPGYMDELVYANSPVHYLGGMAPDHPYIQQYNQHKGVIVVGQGPWEVTDSTFALRDIFAQKGINVTVDIWGHDVRHDWEWWYKQVPVHLPNIL